MAAIPWALFGRFVAARALSYWVEHGGLGAFSDSDEQDPLRGHKATLVWDRPSDPHLSTRDTEMTSMYFVSAAGIVTGDYFTDDEMDAVDAALYAFWQGIRGQYAPYTVLTELRHYSAGSEFLPVGTPPHAPANPAKRVTPINVGGNETGSNAQLPPQVSSTITLQTASRRHWGRLYLPAPTAHALQPPASGGRWTDDWVAKGPTEFVTMAGALALEGIIPVVWSPSGASFLSISEVHSDDIPDIQRRRRQASVGHRYSLSS